MHCLCSFATIPYEEIVLAAASGGVDSQEVKALAFLRMPRLLRLGRWVGEVEALVLHGRPAVPGQ